MKNRPAILTGASQPMRAFFAALLFSIITFSAFAPRVFAQGQVYRYTSTSFTGTWNEISGSGTNVGSGDNNTYTFTGPPFAFNYDSVSYAANSTMYIQTNGYFGWSSIATNYNDGVGNFSSNANAVCLFACDLYTNGGMLTKTTGSAPNRVFTVEFYNWFTYYNSGYTTSMEANLYETSNIIEIVFKDHSYYVAAPSDGNGGGTGLNGQSSHSPNDYIRYGGTAQTSTPSSDVRFTPPSVLPPQELWLTPKNINFGTAAPGVPITMAATVSSVGAVGTSIHITGTSLSGSPAYSIISGPPIGTAVPQGTSVQYLLQFAPFSAGTLTSKFTVATDGRDSGTQSINLTGIGAVPTVSYSSTSMFRGVNTRVTLSSAPQYLYINSTGAGPLAITSVNFTGLDGAKAYSIIHMPAATIPPGGVDSIGVVFTPDLEGLPDAKLLIASNAVNIPLDTVSLYGVGILPHLVINHSYPNPITVNFDSVKLGVDSCLLIQLNNPGSDTLHILRNYYESADFDYAITPLTGKNTAIPPGDSASIQVCFTPLQQGFREATIHIFTDIPLTQTAPTRDTSQFTINIYGTGVPTGQLSITGPSTNGTASVGSQCCVTDTLWNNGGAALVVTSLKITGTNGSDFSGSYPALPLTIGANSFQTFSICASPSDTGNRSGLLTGVATSNESQSIATLGLKVYGTSIRDTSVVVTPFSVLTCAGDSDVETITIKNTGNVAETYTATINGTDSADFRVSPSSSSLESTGGVATFHVTFVPSTNGAETATLTINGGQGHTIALNAIGGTADIAGAGTFPLTTIGQTKTITVTVNNTGTCPWTPGLPSVTAPFSYVSGGTTPIAAGGSTPMSFKFAPTVAGTFNQKVAFPNAVGVSLPPANVTLSGDGTSASVNPVSESNGYKLNQNYPNPFGSTSSIEITLPEANAVNLTIMNLEGQVVQTVLNQHFDAGTYNVSIHADGLASGAYYYQMSAGTVTLTRQMVIVK